MNIFEFAMKMEQDGKSMYLELAEKANLKGVQKIFRMLADDEQKHFEIFQEMKDKPQVETMKDSQALEGAKNVFEALEEQRDQMSTLEGDLPAYTKAMEIEAESARLYREAAEKESNASVKGFLEKIAAEEEKHYNILENLYLFANAPNQYLEWQEFSNTGNFEQFGRKVDQ